MYNKKPVDTFGLFILIFHGENDQKKAVNAHSKRKTKTKKTSLFCQFMVIYNCKEFLI